jgi:flagellar biosynthesis/type III secretory pathway protein FliH
LDVIMAALPAAVRQILEARMQRYEYQSDFARKYYGQGREEGREEGRQQGREEGLRGAVIALARSKLESLSDGDVEAIEAVSDPGVLTAIVTSLGDACNADAARIALDRALRRAP